VTAHGSARRVVAIVGIDGAGKTTQARLLAAWLTGGGHPADYWQNAGGRRWFGRFARIIGRRDAQDLLGIGGMLFIESVLRWLAIGRALVRSRLRRHIAVMDRYSWCQYASIRAHARGTLAQSGRRERRTRWFYGLFPQPDLTVFLAVTPGRAHARVEARGTDHEDLHYLAAADAAYRSLTEADRFVVVDANRGPAEVQHDLRKAVAMRFELVPPVPVPPARPVDQQKIDR
jgi:thymidylate kinase